MNAEPGSTVYQPAPGGWQVGSVVQQFVVPHPAPLCKLRHQWEYRDGYKTSHESLDHHHTAKEARDQWVTSMNRRGIPHTIDGLTVTYEDTEGTPEDLHATVTLTWGEP